MPKNFNEKLIELLKTDARFIDEEGELVKAAVTDRAWKIDPDLVRLLLSDADIKAKFFDEIEGHWIFNLNTFIEYVSDKNFLANAYTRFRNRIGLNIDDKFLQERGEVSLVWPYKDCVLEGGQTNDEEKRKEIFFNEILAQDEIDRLFDPKVLTQWKRYTVDGEEDVMGFKRDESGTIRENLIIKGNNLVALHTLKQQFYGKVKLIYIDPPYNINGDGFGYNDNFKHSSWLTFMRNRLEVARELLKNEGIIFLHIGDQEMDYAETITLERLKKVVEKRIKVENKLSEEIEYDTGGISKSVAWKGGGDFVYCEVMQYNEAYMDKIQAAQSSKELVALWRDIAENSFLNWYVNPEIPEDAVNDFIAIGEGENGVNKQKKLLVELLDKNQLYVNLSEIDDEDFGISAEDKELNEEFYGQDPDEGLELRDEFVADLQQTIADVEAGGKTIPAEKVAEKLGLNW